VKQVSRDNTGSIAFGPVDCTDATGTFASPGLIIPAACIRLDDGTTESNIR